MTTVPAESGAVRLVRRHVVAEGVARQGVRCAGSAGLSIGELVVFILGGCL